MHSEKNALCVVALLDGRPGHVKQTMGIIQALEAESFCAHYPGSRSQLPLWCVLGSDMSSFSALCRGVGPEN